jgi:hypothetical protein
MKAAENDTLFPRRRPPGTTRSVWFVRCRTCEREQGWSDTGSPQEIKEKRLRGLGWHVGRHRSGDECPECVQAKKPIGPVGEAMIRAGIVTEENVVELKRPPAPFTPTVLPPTPPTRADLRRVHDALEDAYPKPEAGYAKSHTDASVAASLNVPRKWVEDVRAQFFGPAVVFDLAGARAQHDRLLVEARELADAALAATDRLEAKLKEVDQALAVLARVMEHGK